MWCVTPKQQRENIKLTVILTFIEPCNMPGIKCFNEFLSVKTD